MKNISELCVSVEPLAPSFKVADVGDIFLDKSYDRLLSLPVVHEGRPIGAVSRSQVQQIFMSRFGRELYGNKPIEEIMNTAPLIVSINQPVEAASQYITRNISFPITEDFIVTDDDSYHGVGSVIDLIHGLESRLLSQNRSLAQAYERLKASQAQLVQSEKMASLGQMVAGVAHEINTPLGYVKSNLEIARDAYTKLDDMNASFDMLLGMLQSPDTDEPTFNEHLAEMLAMRREAIELFPREGMDSLFSDSLYGLQQISEIVTNLKDFSRLDRAPVDDVDINQCIDAALRIGNNVIKHKAEVVRDYGALPRICCSPSQINQVFLNLVTNAAHAIDGRGRITIKTFADERHIHVVVKDNGKGISPENLKKIYDPFFTTKPVGQGTGLGLSIVFGIVKDHKGHIQVKSEVGKGTAFCVSLPVMHVLN